MSFERLKPIEGGHSGCLNCGYQYDILPMDALIAVGIGGATVTKDHEVVYDENQVDEDEFWTAEMVENEALKDPSHDWRIHLVAPLSERHYQRQGDNQWILYEKCQGFA